jgi:hypothetical protein
LSTQEKLEAVTGEFARKQRLIFKGKVLDAGKTLAAQQVGRPGGARGPGVAAGDLFGDWWDWR